MDSTRLPELIKILGLGEKLYLDIDTDDKRMVGLIEEIVLNYILSSLTKEGRIKFYDLIEKSKEPKEITEFLFENINNFESNLVERIKEEVAPLLRG